MSAEVSSDVAGGVLSACVVLSLMGSWGGKLFPRGFPSVPHGRWSRLPYSSPGVVRLPVLTLLKTENSRHNVPLMDLVLLHGPPVAASGGADRG